MDFLSNILREEGGFGYKKAILWTLFLFSYEISQRQKKVACLIFVNSLKIVNLLISN